MKLEKLLTLSQFVDLAKAIKYGFARTWEEKEGFETSLKLIYKYNDFLKQPLKKGMFVNELEKPEKYKPCDGCNDGCSCNKCYAKVSILIHDKGVWEAAEMKVIFKDVKYCNALIKYPLDVNVGGAMELRDNYLYDLAEATEGKLEIKNVIL